MKRQEKINQKEVRKIHRGEKKSKMKKLEEYVRNIPDFPKKGIIFRDITSVLQEADGLHLAIDGLLKQVEKMDFDVVVAPGEVVKAGFVIELTDLNEREKFKNYKVSSLIT